MSEEKGADKPAPPDINFAVPEWAAKPPYGTHLDVMKGDKVVQKLMIDERASYIFGRSPLVSDFVIDHESCSRAHAMLVYHGKLTRFFLVDLKSTYGTFIDSRRLEDHTLSEVPMICTFSFGGSTRRYKIQDRPAAADAEVAPTPLKSGMKHKQTVDVGDLPVEQDQLDSLTEYNTALNKRLTMPTDDSIVPSRKAKREGDRVQFNDEEDVINPEDIDPSVGRFRGLVTTAVIPHKGKKQAKDEAALTAIFGAPPPKKQAKREEKDHRNDAEEPKVGFGPISASLGISLQMTAPDVDSASPAEFAQPTPVVDWRVDRSAARAASRYNRALDDDDYAERAHKKYDKEAWPGRV